jgi:hypothetical protein
MKAAHDQRNRAAADVIPAAAVIIGYATLTHIYDSKDCSTVLHKCMLLSRKYFLLRENYTTMCFKPMIRIRTPVKQYAHTGSSEIRTPMKRNLQIKKFRTKKIPDLGTFFVRNSSFLDYLHQTNFPVTTVPSASG